MVHSSEMSPRQLARATGEALAPIGEVRHAYVFGSRVSGRGSPASDLDDLVPSELAEQLGLAAGLRNVLVHDYAEVDLTILARAVAQDIDDLRRYGGHVGALLPE